MSGAGTGVMQPDGEIQFPGNHIPKKIREANERAERLQREATERRTAEIAERDGKPVEPPAPTTVVNPQAPNPAPVQQPTTVVDTDAAGWKQKYDTIQGKYNAEVPALNLRARNAEQQLQVLQGQVNTLQTIIANSAPPKGAAPSRPVTDISPEDRETYGEELINKARGWARAEIEPEINQLKNQVSQVEGRTREQQQFANQNMVAAHLDRVLPDWNTINNSPEFIQWLAQNAPYTSTSKQELIGKAYNAGDAAGVARFFTDYVNEHTGRPVSEPTPAHTPQGAGKVSLETLAAPGPGRAANPGAPAAKMIWTHAAIAAFYTDVQKGKFRNNPAEQARLEADIFAAPSEGRLR